MKNTILLIITLFFISCKDGFEPCSTEIPKNSLVERTKFINAFEDAKWYIYMWNVSLGDEAVKNSQYNEENRVTERLSSLDLNYDFHKWTNDTLTFYFSFERNMIPVDHSYIISYSTWFSEGAYGLNFYETVRIVNETGQSDLKEFISYLSSNKDNLSPWLKCALTKRQE